MDMIIRAQWNVQINKILPKIYKSNYKEGFQKKIVSYAEIAY